MPQSIDTLGYVKHLEERGFPRANAEALAQAANQFLFPQLVTKDDLLLVEAGLKKEMPELKHDITLRTLTIVASLNGLLFALIKLT
jgi:hypothetical protein